MGGAASGRKGSAMERELVNYLDAAGWGALRLPASGSATDRDLPDVLVGRPVDATVYDRDGYVVGQSATETWAIEAKAGKATTLYVDESEVADLRAFAETWGATPYLSARSTQQATDTRHYLVRPEDARRTDGGAFGLPIAELEVRASVVVGPEGVERL